MQFVVGKRRVTVNVANQGALLQEISERLRLNRGFAVATLNLDHLVKLRGTAFAEAYAAHDLVSADGNPIVWMSRLAGRPVELVTGSDLIRPLMTVAAKAGAPVAFFGSDNQTLTLAAALLKIETPDLTVAAKIAPSMGFVPDGPDAEAMIRQLQASGARLVLVALGAPKQEIFAALLRRIAPEIGVVSIGAGLDFIAKRQQRAPAWMRALALEWLWRMAGDPKRLFKRYLLCLRILPFQALAALKLRVAQYPAPPSDGAAPAKTR